MQAAIATGFESAWKNLKSAAPVRAVADLAAYQPSAIAVRAALHRHGFKNAPKRTSIAGVLHEACCMKGALGKNIGLQRRARRGQRNRIGAQGLLIKLFAIKVRGVVSVGTS